MAVLLIAHSVRATMWGFLAAVATASGLAIAALCGPDWVGILREIRLGLRDLVDALRPNPSRQQTTQAAMLFALRTLITGGREAPHGAFRNG